MEIKNQILKPLFDRIESEWKDLRREVSTSRDEEALSMVPTFEQKLRQLECLRVSTSYQDNAKNASFEITSLREALRQLKLEVRFARRRWKRHLVAQERMRKRQEKLAASQIVAA